MLRKQVTRVLRSTAQQSVVQSRHKLTHQSQYFATDQVQTHLKVENPYTGEIHAEVPLMSLEECQKAIAEADEAQKEYWAITRCAGGLMERQQTVLAMIELFKKKRDQFAKETTLCMGKPLHQAECEVDTMIERAEMMLELSTLALKDVPAFPKHYTYRIIKKEPKGNVLLLAPWNYPLACAINSIIPAYLAGNSVILKHSHRSPTIGPLFEEVFNKLDVPKGLFKAIQCENEITQQLIAEDPRIHHVVYTGSVEGGRQVQRASTMTGSKFIDCTLELGGKDAMYIAKDADTERAAAELVDGAIYNAGQSCCAVERAYVHESVYERVLSKAADHFNNLVLGDPMNETTTVGPMCIPEAPAFLQAQIDEAVSKGARIVAGTGQPCSDASGKGRFFSPTLLRDCNHEMSLMKEESFGPILGVMPVKDDAEAIELMNDSRYGLTASVYTKDRNTAERMSIFLDVGTVFMNQCDYCAPDLGWAGTKDSGKGVSLGSLAYQQFYKTKSLQFKLPEMKRPKRIN